MRESAGSAAVAAVLPGEVRERAGDGVGRTSGPTLTLVGDPPETHRGGNGGVEAGRAGAHPVETVGRFAVSIAHDFNSLCAALVYFAEAASSCVESGGDPTAFLGHIAETAQSAGELSRQILSFTRDQISEPIRLPLASAVSELTPLLRCLAGPERDLDIVAGGDGATTRMAPSHLRQILLNLLVNAHDATRPGGRITVETGVEDGPSGRCVTLRVTDTGAGMDERTVERCFEPFFTTKGMGKGTGIGLATVRDLVDRYCGRIAADSELGRGSTFTVYLPAA